MNRNESFKAKPWGDPLRVLVFHRQSVRHADEKWCTAVSSVMRRLDISPETIEVTVLAGRASTLRHAAELIRSVNFDLVAVDTLTRISRLSSEICGFLRLCEEFHVRVIACLDEYDSASPNCRDRISAWMKVTGLMLSSREK